MNNNLYNTIENLPGGQLRSEIILLLKKQLPALSGDLDHAIRKAYDITGLMATTYAQSLADSDPINEILTIAGELEIDPDNAAELRTELVSKIKALS